MFIVDQSGEATHGSARPDTQCPSLLDPPRARSFPQIARKRSLKTGASSYHLAALAHIPSEKLVASKRRD